MDIIDIISFILAIILTEALTEIITKSALFQPLRAKIFKIGQNSKVFNWLHSLLDCGYCFSVWASAFVTILFLRDITIVNATIDWFMVTLVLHRLSNLFHNIMDRVHG